MKYFVLIIAFAICLALWKWFGAFLIGTYGLAGFLAGISIILVCGWWLDRRRSSPTL